MALSAAACCASCASAFVVPTLARGICSTSTATAHGQPAGQPAASRRVGAGVLSAEKEAGAEEEQEPMDLDLEQMFEVQPIRIADAPVFVLSASVLMC